VVADIAKLSVDCEEFLVPLAGLETCNLLFRR
jgi:hypothetical protein